MNSTLDYIEGEVAKVKEQLFELMHPFQESMGMFQEAVRNIKDGWEVLYNG